MMIKNDLNELKQADVMALLGRTDRTIQLWHGKGLPRNGEGRGCTYVWADVLAWYVAFVSGSQGGELSHSERLKKVQADDKELDLAVKRGQLLLAEDVRTVWANECAAMRARLLSIPATAALKIDPSHTQAQREAIIRRDIHEALESLSGGRDE